MNGSVPSYDHVHHFFILEGLHGVNRHLRDPVLKSWHQSHEHFARNDGLVLSLEVQQQSLLDQVKSRPLDVAQVPKFVMDVFDAIRQDIPQLLIH